MPNSQNKRKTIGKHGVYTLEQARTEAKRLLLLSDPGIDPVAQKEQLTRNFIQAKQIDELIPSLDDAYNVYKSKKKLSTTTLEAYGQCVNNYFEDWKDMKITEFSQKMILDRYMLLSERSLSYPCYEVSFCCL